jgi:hypothetical protein
VCPGVLWWFNARSHGNMDVVVLMRRRSKCNMNSFFIEDASVIKERVARGSQVLSKARSTECVKLSLAATGNLCGEPVESWRYRSSKWGKFYGNDCSCTVQTATGTKYSDNLYSPCTCNGFLRVSGSETFFLYMVGFFCVALKFLKQFFQLSSCSLLLMLEHTWCV